MKEKKGEHPFGDAGQILALVVFLVVWAGDSFLLQKSTFLSRYVPLSVRLAFFLLSLVASMYLFKSGHVAVSGEERPKKILTTGAFGQVRHPLYLASLLTYLGLTVSTASLFSLALWVGIFIFYDYIAGYEEKIMESRFQDAYRDYKGRTGKWLPNRREKGL